MNITKLNDIEVPVYEFTNLTDSSNLINSLQTTSNEVSGGYYGLGVMIVIFLVMLFITFKETGDVRLDIARSILFSSSMSLIIGFMGLITGFFTSYQHIMWFVIIYLVNLIWVYSLKKKGL